MASSETISTTATPAISAEASFRERLRLESEFMRLAFFDQRRVGAHESVIRTLERYVRAFKEGVLKLSDSEIRQAELAVLLRDATTGSRVNGAAAMVRLRDYGIYSPLQAQELHRKLSTLDREA